MNKEVIPYEESVALAQIGFVQSCWHAYHDLTFPSKEDKHKLEIVHNLTSYTDSYAHKYVNPVLAPTFSQAFRWFRENYDLHVQIRKENYFQQRKYEYYHFDISKGEESDITNQEDLLYKILDECSQDIPGNYLNDEMYSKLIFQKEFAFKTYEEVELTCLRKLIEIVKENKLW